MCCYLGCWRCVEVSVNDSPLTALCASPLTPVRDSGVVESENELVSLHKLSVSCVHHTQPNRPELIFFFFNSSFPLLDNKGIKDI